MEDKFAVKLKDSYVDQVKTFNENLQDILKRGFGMERDEVFDFLSKSERSAHEYCLKELKNCFQQNANQNLLRKFNEHFKKDENGNRREWKDIEEAKIREHFEESKKKVDVVFEQFKRVFFPTGITQIEKETATAMPDLGLNNSTKNMEDLIK